MSTPDKMQGRDRCPAFCLAVFPFFEGIYQAVQSCISAPTGWNPGFLSFFAVFSFFSENIYPFKTNQKSLEKMSFVSLFPLPEINPDQNCTK